MSELKIKDRSGNGYKLLINAFRMRNRQFERKKGAKFKIASQSYKIKEPCRLQHEIEEMFGERCL